MMDCWVAQRPHLKGLADKVRALFTMADEAYQQGRAGVDTTTYKAKLTLDRNDYGIGTDSIAAKISLEDEVDLKLVIVTFQ